MTTIATDGRSLAADSLTTAGGQVVAYRVKVHKLADGRIAACAGDTTECIRLLEWLSEGGEKPSLTDDVEALILNPDGTVDWVGKEFVLLRYVAPMAVGSGGDIALGAMLAGATPEEAVKIAITRDTHSGGDVMAIALPTKLAVAA